MLKTPSRDEIYYDGRTLSQPSVLGTRPLWEAAGPLKASLNFVMDYDLWLRMVQYVEIIFVDRCLSFGRSHPEQKIQTSHHKQIYQEKEQVVLSAARQRGEAATSTFLRAWSRRANRELRSKHLNLRRLFPTKFQRLFPTKFQWAALTQSCDPKPCIVWNPQTPVGTTRPASFRGPSISLRTPASGKRPAVRH